MTKSKRLSFKLIPSSKQTSEVDTSLSHFIDGTTDAQDETTDAQDD